MAESFMPSFPKLTKQDMADQLRNCCRTRQMLKRKKGEVAFRITLLVCDLEEACIWRMHQDKKE